MPDGTTGVEHERDIGTTVARWDAELRSYERLSENWRKDAGHIEDRYQLQGEGENSGRYQHTFIGGDKPKFNILWSNIQTMLPALFSKEPTPVVERRHKDPDPIGRIAAQVLERALYTEMEDDDLPQVGERAVLDNLISGRGTLWVRYDADIARSEVQITESPAGMHGTDGRFQERAGVEDGAGGPVQVDEELLSERAPVDFVHWSQFAHSPHRTWDEVKRQGWVAREVFMTREQGIDRFGEVFKDVPLNATPSGMNKDDLTDDMRGVLGVAAVWELWHAPKKQVHWFVRDFKDKMLDSVDDPYGLDGFFPCPRPSYGTLSNKNLIPTPDYLQYAHLADELDSQTERIAVLTKALKLRGVYDASMEGLGTLLSADSRDGEMIGVQDFAQYIESSTRTNSLGNVVQFLPIDMIAGVLVQMYEARQQTKDAIFEISGISDIVRGQSDPRETATAATTKAQFSNQRIDQRRRSVEHLIRGVLRIKAELIAEHFSDETLRAISGYDQLPQVVQERERAQAAQQQAEAEWQQAAQQAAEQGMPPPQPPQPQPDPAEQIWQQAVQLIRDEKRRGFRIDVETDSTIARNANEMAEQRTAFLESAGNFMERSLPLAQAFPAIQPLVGEMLLFAVRGFNAGRTLESAFEDAVESMEQQQQQAAENPQPDPNQVAAEADQAKMQQQGQLDQAKAASAMQTMEAKAQADAQRAEMELALKQQEMQAKMMEIEAKMEAAERMSDIERQKAMADLEIERERLAMDWQRVQQDGQRAAMAAATGGAQ